MDTMDDEQQQYSGSERRKDVIKIPTALAGILFTLIAQLIVGVWYAGQQSAKFDVVVTSLAKLEARFEAAELTRVSRAEMRSELDQLWKAVGDHETRTRAIERGK